MSSTGFIVGWIEPAPSSIVLSISQTALASAGGLEAGMWPSRQPYIIGS